MTSIKPPDGRSPASPLGPAAGRDVEGAEKTGGPAFRELLQGVEGGVGGARPAGAAEAQSSVASASSAQAAGTSDPVGALAQAVRAGTITPQQAVEQLVDRAVSSVGRSLSDAQRAELVTVLQQALQNDPALRELREAIG